MEKWNKSFHFWDDLLKNLLEFFRSRSGCGEAVEARIRCGRRDCGIGCDDRQDPRIEPEISRIARIARIEPEISRIARIARIEPEIYRAQVCRYAATRL